MRINFRSHYSHATFSGNSEKKSKHGTDWDGISEYKLWDARHIIWKKSTQNIVEKTFEENAEISLIVWVIHEKWDDFSTKDGISKKNYKKKAVEILEKNARESRIPLRKIEANSLSELETQFEKNAPRKNLIIVIGNEIPKEKSYFCKIASINDIIWIFPWQSFEKNPDDSALFEGKIFQTSKLKAYLEEIKNFEENTKKFLKKNKISFIPTLTHIGVDNILNHYFKHEFER